MTARDTGTGGVLEAMILPALDRGGYAHRAQVVVGKRIGGRPHRVDAIAVKDGREVLVSMKWQQVGGTAEQKVPFEVLCLAEAVRSGPYDAAYLVLGGDGWTLRDYFTSAATTRELLQALAYPKFGLDGDDILATLAAYLPFTEAVDIDGASRGSLPVCRDRHDQMFLELALAAEADVLVTGDNALLALDGRVPFAIEFPAVFRERFEADER